MEEVPNIISTEDLFLIRDVLVKEHLFCKKINLYKNNATDELKDYLDKVFKSHKDDVISIMKLLD